MSWKNEYQQPNKKSGHLRLHSWNDVPSSLCKVHCNLIVVNSNLTWTGTRKAELKTTTHRGGGQRGGRGILHRAICGRWGPTAGQRLTAVGDEASAVPEVGLYRDLAIILHFLRAGFFSRTREVYRPSLYWRKSGSHTNRTFSQLSFSAFIFLCYAAGKDIRTRCPTKGLWVCFRLLPAPFIHLCLNLVTPNVAFMVQTGTFQ